MRQSLILALLRLFAYLPWSWLARLGRLLGWLAYRLDLSAAHDARINLRIAYPGLGKEQLERLLRRSLAASAITFCEMPRIWLRPVGRDTRLDPAGVKQEIQRLLDRGRGLILAMPHHGNWEMVSRGAFDGMKATGLYRRPRQAFLDTLLREGRSNSLVEMVPISRAGIKTLHQALKAGEVVAILPDQVPKQAGAASVAAPFFGRESTTMVLLSRFAARRDTPVLFLWARRLADGRYRLSFFEADEQIRDPDPLTAATALNRAVEFCIADAPEQYQWSYRRFNPTVPGQENPYKRS